MINDLTKQPLTPFNAITSPLSGSNLIEASAGTGKTFTITRIFMRLLLEKRLPLSSILVVTFTEAATHELRERIYLYLKEALEAFTAGSSDDPLIGNLISRITPTDAIDTLKTALASLDTCPVYTIHGFCKKLLSDFAFESSSTFDPDFIKSQSEYVSQAAQDFWRVNFYTTAPGFINYLKTNKVLPETFESIFDDYNNYNSARIIPDCTPVDYSPVEAHLQSLTGLFFDQWTTQKTEIIDCLNKCQLSKTSYSDAKIVAGVIKLDHIAANGSVTINDKKSLELFTLTKIKNSFKKGSQLVNHDFFTLCDDLLECVTSLDTLYEKQLEYFYSQSISFIKTHVIDAKKRNNAISFDDMLNNVYLTLQSSQAELFRAQVLTKYRAALIDEFQDTDPVQYGIFKQLFVETVPTTIQQSSPPKSHLGRYSQEAPAGGIGIEVGTICTNSSSPPAGDLGGVVSGGVHPENEYQKNSTITFFIGDPKQAIYSFRGADVFTYLRASHEVESHFTLDTNYRSAPSLVNAVVQLFTQAAQPFFIDEIDIASVKGGVTDAAKIIDNNLEMQPLQLRFISNKKNSTVTVMNDVICEIWRLIAHGTIGVEKIHTSHIAILVRFNKDAFYYQNALSEIGIPSVIASSASVFSTAEATDFFQLLSAIAKPTDALINAVLTLPFFNFNSSQIYNLSNNVNEFGKWLALFTNAQAEWYAEGFGVMINRFFRDLDIEQTVLSQVSGERKITNYYHIKELLEKETTSGHDRPGALLALLSRKIKMAELKSSPSDDELIRLDTDDDAVQIMTVHKSKGLEFDIVFCPDIGIVKSVRSNTRKGEPCIVHDDHGTPLFVIGKNEIEQHEEQYNNEQLAENLRLLYVALTRAKSLCYLYYEDSKDAQTSSLTWLLFSNQCAVKSVSSLNIITNKQPDEFFLDALEKQTSLSDAIAVTKVPEIVTSAYYSEKRTDEHDDLVVRKFTGKVASPWRIASYSLLTHSGTSQPQHFEMQFDEREIALNLQKSAAVDFDIFSFPRGAKSGTLLHDIIEATDLSAEIGSDTMEQVTASLEKNGYETTWTTVITDMLTTLQKVSLKTADATMTLGQIDKEHCIKEMEFYFPLKPVTHREIRAVFEDQQTLFGDIYTAEGLSFETLSGFIKGYVDMIFEHDDRFYIIDWKSNYLGSTSQDYTPDKLRKVMNSEHYVLQYYLYTVALDQYLRVHKPGYSYKKHFGGVLYLFLRGLSLEGNTGIFYDRPDFGKVEALRGVLLG
ncbi:MAG: UvrD-helicase domain-containing protein [Fibrobacter sp.]|mgnify:CR=1 FL=1|nr:UvrD-helicase domain-containing protein [Fibrobacter sp.]